MWSQIVFQNKLNLNNKMATNQPTNVATNQMAQFDYVATRIHQTFDPLIAQLIARRDALLLELSQLREDHASKETTRRAAIREIEMAQQQVQELSKVNINIPVHQEANQAYKQALERLETPIRLPCLRFQCHTLPQLESLIAELGGIVTGEVPDYSLKREPVLAAGKNGSGSKELRARGLAIDEANKLIYVADYGNSRVQIVSFEGYFIKQFGKDKLSRPWGIALTKEYIYVTDIALHALFQFDKKTFQLVNRTGTMGHTDGQLNYPRGLCIDYSGGVFVADDYNNRVCVFSKELQFLSNLGVGQLESPTDIKLTPDCLLAVLDWSPKCVHFFSMNGHLLSSCVSLGGGPDCLVYLPSFFCIDTAGNLIISDWGRHSIKIVDGNDQLLHTVGKQGYARGGYTYHLVLVSLIPALYS